MLSKEKKSSQPEPLESNEIISRFIFDRSYIRKTVPIIKYNAFLPNPDNGKASVFRKEKMSKEYYEEIKEKVERARKREKKGAALVEVVEVDSAGVCVNPEESEYLWHADIEGWPLEKDKIMSIAQQIAAKAKLEE